MADIVNIHNRHVYQHNRKKMRKSNIRNSRNLKIAVVFRSHLEVVRSEVSIFFKPPYLSKTDFVLFSRGYIIKTFKLPRLNDREFPLSSGVKYLGIILDNKLN